MCFIMVTPLHHRIKLNIFRFYYLLFSHISTIPVDFSGLLLTHTLKYSIINIFSLQSAVAKLRSSKKLSFTSSAPSLQGPYTFIIVKPHHGALISTVSTLYDTASHSCILLIFVLCIANPYPQRFSYPPPFRCIPVDVFLPTAFLLFLHLFPLYLEVLNNVFNF